MKRDERLSLMRQKAKEVVQNISPNANHLIEGDIDGGATAMCVIYEDKKDSIFVRSIFSTMRQSVI